MPDFYTRAGDDGFTGLLGSERVPKYDPRPEAYGTLDEASAVLGLARSLSRSAETGAALLSVQGDLYHIMTEIAASGDESARFAHLPAERVAWLEKEIEGFGTRIEIPKEFVVAGDSTAGAALDLARTVVRRGERLVARLHHSGEAPNPDVLRYLNRLSSLCFVLALWENRVAGVARPTLARDAGT